MDALLDCPQKLRINPTVRVRRVGHITPPACGKDPQACVAAIPPEKSTRMKQP
jgi:hypothetical protein